MKPWLLETAEEFKGKVKFVAVDVDKSGDVAEEYGIEAMPTFVLIKNGKEVSRIKGGRKDKILSMIDDSL